jgi:hypothetical protein
LLQVTQGTEADSGRFREFPLGQSCRHPPVVYQYSYLVTSMLATLRGHRSPRIFSLDDPYLIRFIRRLGSS